VVGVREPADLRDREALLLVDNFEHLLDAAPAIRALLSAAPNTKVLVTGRGPFASKVSSSMQSSPCRMTTPSRC